MVQDQTQKYTIICLSNQLWDFPNWTNKRHVMSRLAQGGHTVLFVDPPINVGFVFFRQLRRGLWTLKRLLTQIKKNPSGAFVYTPLNFFPFPAFTTKLHIKRLKKLTKNLAQKDTKIILWVYHVQITELESYLTNLAYDLLVYDCVDNYLGFPQEDKFYSTIVPKEKVAQQEKMLTERADIVFATAPGLVEKLKKYNKNVHFMPNVGDYPKFVDAKKIKEKPEDIKNIRRPIVAFTGALDSYKFDLELFKKVAGDHPGISFVLIGQIALKDKGTTLEAIGLSQFENVYFLGQKPYADMEKYYSAFDAYIIPYVLNDYTVGGCFPVKFHEALAVGLPVVVTDMPAYIPFSDVCYISKTDAEFSANVKLALAEDSPAKIKARQAVAKENNWDGKVAKMVAAITAEVMAKRIPHNSHAGSTPV